MVSKMKNMDLTMKKIIVVILLTLLFTLGFIGGIYLINLKSDEVVKDETQEKIVTENTTSKKEIGRIVTRDEIKDNISINVEYPEIGIKKIDEDIISNVDSLVEEVSKSNEESIKKYYSIRYEIYVDSDYIVSVIFHEKLENSNLNLEKDDEVVLIYNLNTKDKLSYEDIFKEGGEEVLSSYGITKESFRGFNKGNVLLSNGEVSKDKVEEVLNIDVSSDDNYSSDGEEIEYTIINKYYKLNSDVVIRKEASLDSETLVTLVKDTKVGVYTNSNKGWSSVITDSGMGYVETRYLDEIVEDKVVDEPVLPTTNPVTEVTMYTTASLNFRSEPSSAATLLGVIASGEAVVKIGEAGGWSKIRYNNVEGYVSSSYLAKNKIVHYEVKLNVNPQGDIDPTKPMVALTFDDGPNGTSTPRILNTLEKYNVKATFFDLGYLVTTYPEIVKREEKIGEVGLHSYNHKNLNKLTEAEIIADVTATKQAFNQVLGHDPILFRPPYGNANDLVKANVGMPLINWSVDSLDWKYRNVDLTMNEINKYGNLDGKIILMHSIHNATADTVEVLIPDLLSKGYQIVTVSELAYYRGYTLQTGIIYHSFK